MSEYPEVDALGRLMELAARHSLEELQVEGDGLKITLQAQPRPAGADTLADTGLGYLWHPPSWSEPGAGERPPTAHALVTPLTGTFYRAQSPTDPPLVEVGTVVEEGQKVGLIEAMKVYSEIVADRAGVVTEVVAQNGKLVQHGDVLMYIDPT